MYKATAGVAEFRKTDGEVLFPNGGVVFFRSLDEPDNARGLSADGWVLDEAADVTPGAFYDVIQPMLIENDQSWLIAPHTPKGRNWVWREQNRAQDRDDSMTWQIPTVGCEVKDGVLVRKPHPLENPDIPFSEIERLFATMPEQTFRQEILAEYLEGEGAVFRNIPSCMKAPATTPDAHRGHRIVAGNDWGKQADFTTISVGCATCRVEVERDRFNQIDYSFQRKRLKTLSDKWGFELLPERNSIGEPIIEQLLLEGFDIARGVDGKLGFNTSATTKPPLIENLALTLERTEWQFQNDPVWTAEMEAYEREVSPITGRSSYSAPEGMHDDTVMARALMVWQARAMSEGEYVENPLYD